MTDDIVTRLREMCGCWTAVTYYQNKCDNCLAADEIERLLEEVEHWRRIAETEHAMWANNVAVGDINDR